jgi:hypothetical protein
MSKAGRVASLQGHHESLHEMSSLAVVSSELEPPYFIAGPACAYAQACIMLL